MMWPILTKVRYEALPGLLPTRHTLTHVLLSLALNWIAAPLLMLALAWATLPDLPTYRAGVLMVGLARCIAMVMVWNALARGDGEYCAILVVLNSLLQIVLYAPLALLFVNILGGGGGVRQTIHVSYGDVAISVLIYLGIPLAAGIVTRFVVLRVAGRTFFETRFVLYFSPLALLGLLYTIVVMFAYQGHHIAHNLGPVFRVFVPLIVYFALMWTSAFLFVWWCATRRAPPRSAGAAGTGAVWTYEMAVVQSFTAASNNFVSTPSLPSELYHTLTSPRRCRRNSLLQWPSLSTVLAQTRLSRRRSARSSRCPCFWHLRGSRSSSGASSAGPRRKTRRHVAARQNSKPLMPDQWRTGSCRRVRQSRRMARVRKEGVVPVLAMSSYTLLGCKNCMTRMRCRANFVCSGHQRECLLCAASLR